MIEVEVEDAAWSLALPTAGPLVDAAARAALVAASHPPDHVAVLLTGDDEVAEMNGRFRGQAAPTNVLSFPAPATAAPHLGDIALAYGVCAREAEAQGKPLAHHLAHLVVHGALHLVGYDHGTDAEAEVMETMERTILRGLDIPDPYPREAISPPAGIGPAHGGPAHGGATNGGPVADG